MKYTPVQTEHLEEAAKAETVKMCNTQSLAHVVLTSVIYHDTAQMRQSKDLWSAGGSAKSRLSQRRPDPYRSDKDQKPVTPNSNTRKLFVLIEAFQIPAK